MLQQSTQTAWLTMSAIYATATTYIAQRRQFKRDAISASTQPLHPVPDSESSQSTAAPVLIHLADGILTLTLNRPQVLNAINLAMAEQLREQLAQAANNPAIRAIVITGAGRAFCFGGDLKFAHQANPDRLGDSFLALTAILHTCGTFMLPRLVGMGRALEIILLDDLIPAPRAEMLGLVQRLVPDAQLTTETHKLAERMVQMPINTLGQVKRLMNESFYSTLSEQLAAERQEIAIAANSMEGREGIAAFLHKRQPQYMGLDVA